MIGSEVRASYWLRFYHSRRLHTLRSLHVLLCCSRDFIANVLAADRKCLIFAHHQEMMDAVESCVVDVSLGLILLQLVFMQVFGGHGVWHHID